MNALRSLTWLSALVALVVLGQVPLGAAGCLLEPAEAAFAQPEAKSPSDVGDDMGCMPGPAVAVSMRAATAKRAAAARAGDRHRKAPAYVTPDATGPPRERHPRR